MFSSNSAETIPLAKQAVLLKCTNASGRGTQPLHEGGHLERSWIRLRRKAQARGVRSLKLHSTRHTHASLALAFGKSVKWVADQLGHSTPVLTLRTMPMRGGSRSRLFGLQLSKRERCAGLANPRSNGVASVAFLAIRRRCLKWSRETRTPRR